MSFYTLSESANRYSVEVNYRTTLDEVEDGFVQLVLGFISAAMKRSNYHAKMVTDEKPYRVVISARKWQEGEWVNIVSWNSEHKCFVISEGFYNKPTKNVIVQKNIACSGKSAADVFKEVWNAMHHVKDRSPHHQELEPLKGSPGPRKGSMRPGQGLMNKGRTQSQGAQSEGRPEKLD
jgi:hypothetical protein